MVVPEIDPTPPLPTTKDLLAEREKLHAQLKRALEESASAQTKANNGKALEAQLRLKLQDNQALLEAELARDSQKFWDDLGKRP